MRDRVEDLLQQPQAPILGRRPPDARQAVARSHIGTSTRGHGPRVHHDQIVPAHIRHQQSAAPTPTRRTVRPQRRRAPSHPPRGRERKQRDEMADISLACWSRPTDSGRPVRAAHCYPAANTRPRFLAWSCPTKSTSVAAQRLACGWDELLSSRTRDGGYRFVRPAEASASQWRTTRSVVVRSASLRGCTGPTSGAQKGVARQSRISQPHARSRRGSARAPAMDLA
jgi:hypothetical protein